MNYLKLGGGLAGLLVAAFLFWAVRDRFRLADEVAGYRACAVAVATPDGELGRCQPAVRAVAEEARRSRTCDAAIGQGAAGLYAVRASCGENVKRQGAELVAARGNIADLDNQLATERAGRLDAIARAEARSTVHATRRATQNETIRTQPRTPGGRVSCDAVCLRALGGDPPAGSAGPGG